jgi:hypothetical protein
MSLFTRIRNVVDSSSDAQSAEAVGVPPSWNTPVPYDSTLVQQLIARHDELDRRVAALQPILGGHPAVAESTVRDCATALHDLRHLEALRLYPVIARGISPDPIARRLFWQSRLVMLGLARRVMRRFDELTRALQSGKGVDAAAAHVVSGLTEYRRRNESSMYPMYDAIGQRVARARARVA